MVEASGSELGKVVKTTVRLLPLRKTHHPNYEIQVFFKNLGDFQAVNAIYAATFGDHKPARSAVEVARLPADVLIEIECIARCESPAARL